ncbi:hypothetical protein JHK82_034886 [Glycine max]|nr:hypothetical protein JHK85_035594 [Glycine max]KAG5111617.1 hypothetical protein JHK82_034886 [Glycine max]
MTIGSPMRMFSKLIVRHCVLFFSSSKSSERFVWIFVNNDMKEIVEFKDRLAA